MKRLLLTCTDLMGIQFLVPHIKHLSENGFEVSLACSNVGGRIDELKTDLEGIARVSVVRLKRSPLALSNFSGYKDLKRIISENKFDVIWTNEPVMGVMTRLASRKARKLGTKVIYMAHGFHFYKGSSKLNWLIYYPIEKALSRITDRLITINGEDFNIAKQKFSCEVKYVHGIGVDSSRFSAVSNEQKSALREELSLPSDAKILINIGELSKNKNQTLALNAMRILVKNDNKYLFLIAGKGPEKENYEKFIAENGLENNVILLGYTKKVHEYLNACDLLVPCSIREGLPLNLMEAMLCAKPIVASDNRGHRELVINNKNGYLVNNQDYETFAAKIISTLTEENDFSNNSLEMVQPFLIDNVKTELLNSIKEIV